MKYNVLIEPVSGYDKQVGHLVSVLDVVRRYTLGVTRNLSMTQLDYYCDDKANSIASLLMHIGAMEYFVFANFFPHNEYFSSAFQKWKNFSAENLKNRGGGEYEIDYYVNALADVRKESLSLLKEIPDYWLYKEEDINVNVSINRYFKIFHLAQDESSHTGQILYMLKRIPKDI